MVSNVVEARNRFTKARPCPVCGGYDRQERGEGSRCFGFLSDDGRWAHCTREEHAGGIPFNSASNTYAHKLRGECNCGTRHGAPESEIVATYDYHDEDGRLAHQTVRKFPPKSFLQRRPDASTADGWAWNLKGCRIFPYRLPQLMTADPAEPVLIPEGEKDCDNLARLGFVSTTNPMGAGKWREAFNRYFAGRRVVVLPDNDDEGKRHAQQVLDNLRPVAASVRILGLSNLPPKGDVSDWLANGGTPEELRRLVATPAAVPNLSNIKVTSVSLGEVIYTFRKWLYMPDTGPLEVALATVLANYAGGDPVWLLLIAPPGSGKTEVINTVAALPKVHSASTITEASLLSGVSKRDVHKEAKGGLLREIGEFGILALKDFGGILSMHEEQRAAVLAALREIYDGRWTRYIGTDGGRPLAWEGKIGLIGGATPAIDRHHSLNSQLGERFAYYRIPEEGESERAYKALHHAGAERQMRAELSAAVCGLFAGLKIPETRADISDEEEARLVALARLTTRCRSAVLRDPRTREIEQVVGAESPTRFVVVLALLLSGLDALGVTRDRAWQLLGKVALDSMPQLRRRCLELLAATDHKETTKDIALSINHPTQTTRRALEELTCYGIAHRESEGEGHADEWCLTDLARSLYQAITTFPEIPEPVYNTQEEEPADTLIIPHTTEEDFSGKVPSATCIDCGAEAVIHDTEGEGYCGKCWAGASAFDRERWRNG